jgi:hypothetical protein
MLGNHEHWYGELGEVQAMFRDFRVPLLESSHQLIETEGGPFAVEDVGQATAAVLRYGGSKAGEISSSPVESVGLLTFVYLADPEGNIIELQAWE